MTIRRRLVLGCLLLSASAHADPASPVGDWRTFDDRTGRERGLVRITETKEGLAARVLATVDPAEGQHVCEKCTDDRKDSPIIGLEILRGMHRDGDGWAGGRILDPETGSIYQCEMHLEDGGRRLVVRGYVGFSLFGRSQVWVRQK